jgi:hypothetical protein
MLSSSSASTRSVFQIFDPSATARSAMPSPIGQVFTPRHLVAAERALIDPAVGSARERHAHMLELDHRVDRVPGHVLDRLLVAEPVRALDRVVHVPAPVVLTHAHVAEGGADPALRRNGMAAGRINLADASGLEAGAGRAESRAQTRPAADYDDVVAVGFDRVSSGHRPAFVTAKI